MKKYLTATDFSVSREEFDLLLDEKLDMLVTQPQPKDLSKYYDSEAYISHTDSKNSFFDKTYQFVKRFNLKSKLALASKYASNTKSILDIGSGTGDFLLLAKQKGWFTSGVEPNAMARRKSKEKEVEVLAELGEIKEGQFQIITLWHVLEHLPDLEVQLKTIENLLRDDGALIVAVPNFKSCDANYYGNHWAAYDVPRHLWHFSRKSIEAIFANFHMKVIETKPMWFDAFYVSILSEKYKGSKFSIPRGLVVGLYSNVKAIFTKQPSSLIYVLKKQ